MYFSNRSAAYLSKKDAENALSDAEQCIKLNTSWAKGYSRKGAALHALRRYDEAKEVYEEGTYCPCCGCHEHEGNRFWFRLPSLAG